MKQIVKERLHDWEDELVGYEVIDWFRIRKVTAAVETIIVQEGLNDWGDELVGY